jgi:hypothetical protein
MRRAGREITGRVRALDARFEVGVGRDDCGHLKKSYRAAMLAC